MKASNYIVFMLTILTIMLAGNLFGETIYNETTGTASSITLVNSYTGWLNYGTVTYSGTADTRNTNPSTGYSGASGAGNTYFIGGSSNYMQIAGINTLGYTNIRLACGIFKTNIITATGNAENGSNFQIRYSTDGTTWSSPLVYTLPTGTGTNSDYTWITFSEALPAVANLYLKFTDVGATEPVHFRLDDVTVTGTTFNIYNETVGNGSIGISVGSYTGWNFSTPITYSGTAGVQSSYSSAGTYTNASGNGNVYIPNDTYLSISGINTTGYTDIWLSFGVHKDNSAETGTNFQVDVYDGVTLFGTYFVNIPTTSNDLWINRTVAVQIPVTTNLVLKFTDIHPSRDFRIDDIKLRAAIKAPNVSSPRATSITNTTGTLGASIVLLNSDNATERGIYYSTTSGFANGTGTKVSETGTFSAIGTFTLPVTGLTENTIYYFKGFATNIAGTGYSNQGTFTTTNVPPTIALPTVSSVTNTTAILGASITALNSSTATERGIYYSTTDGFANGTGTKVSETGAFSSTDPFTISVTGLTPNTTYYYKGFVTDAAGSGYTVQDTFITTNIFPPTVALPTATGITNTTAVLGASITAFNNSSATERGIYYSTTNGFADGTGTKVSETGTFSTTGAFTISVTGLSPNTLYYYKGFATNAAGSSYTVQDSMTTTNIFPPTVVLPTATGITNTTAVLGASITAFNNSNATERGIYYSTTDGFADGTGTKVSETGTFSTTSAFTVSVTGLSPNTLYYYKGFATNAAGSGYTVQGSMTTTNIFPPTVELPTASSITNTTAVLGASVTTLINGSATERGIYYSTTDGFADGTGTKVSETGTFSSLGAFTLEVTGLSPNTVYYYKGFAINIDGSGYTAQATFTTTNIFPPSITANATANLTDEGATLNANITSTNNALVTERGFYYSSVSGFADGTGTKISETGSFGVGAYSLILTGLDQHTQYYFKAFATNAVGTTYSAQGSINPTVIPPLATIDSPDDAAVVTNSASLNWTDGGGWTYGFKLFMGTDAAATNLTPAGGLDLGYVTTYTPAFINGSTYYWRIQPYNSFGANTTGTIRSFTVSGPLSGTKIIGPGGDYASFTAAINALNTMGVAVGGGGVTFNVTAGEVFTEAMPIPAITATGTLADQVIFRKSGTGANPIVQATGTSVSQEYFFKLLGSDYVTFDGIDLRNTGTTELMDYGYWLQAVATNGCNHNTIQNCTVTLDKASNYTTGIKVYYTNSSSITNNYNKFYNNTINHAIYGYDIYGITGSVKDTGNEIGTTTGTTMINDVSFGAYLAFQTNAKIYNQVITFAASSDISNYGIYCQTCTADVYNNRVQNGISHGSNGMFGYYNSSSQNNVHDNTFTGFSCTYGTIAGINISSGSDNVYRNKIYNLSYTVIGIGTVSGIILTAGSSNVYNNMIWDLRAPASYSTNPCVNGIQIGSSTNKIYNNTVYLYQTATGTNAGITAALTFSTAASYSQDLRNNIFVNKSAASNNPSSRTCAIFKSFTGWSCLTATSGRNIYYAYNTALPGTRNPICYENTSDIANIDAYHTAVGSLDAVSWSEDVPFDLSNLPHITTGGITFAEGNGLPVTSPAITDDIDGNLRDASTPDIGADEGAFTNVGLAPMAANVPNPANTFSAFPPTNVTFSWRAQADQTHGVPTSYKFYLRQSTGTYADMINGIDLGTALSYTPATPLLIGTGYVWKVIPANATGEAMNPPEWCFSTAYLPLNGIYTIDNTLPSGGINFASFSDAISALNYSLISGPVTFRVTSGQTFVENLPAITLQATLDNQVTFVKYGTSANPVIKAGIGKSSTSDAIVTFSCCDYITFDSIDLSENIGVNMTAYTQAEIGFNIYNGSSGAQHNTIRDCNITLANATTLNATGIYLKSSGSAATTNSYNRFLGNSVSGCFNAYIIQGSSSTSAEDIGNEIGSSSRRGTMTGCNYGVYYYHQKSFKIYDQTILLTGANGGSNGIYCNLASTSTVEIYNNNISMQETAHTSGGCTGVYLNSGFSASIHDNVIHDLSDIVATGSYVCGIYVTAGATGQTNNIYNNQVYNLSSLRHTQYGINVSNTYSTNNIYNNVIHDVTSSTTNGGTQYGIYCNAGINNVYDNETYNINITVGSGGKVYGIYAGTGINTIHGNNVHNMINNSTTASQTYGIASGTNTSCLIYENIVRAISSNLSSVAGIYVSGGSASTVRNNKVYDLTYTGTLTSQVNGISTDTGSTSYVYNNFVSDLKAPAIASGTTPFIAGISVLGISNYLWYNTIFLNGTASNGMLNSAAIYISSATSLVEMKNNIFINMSAIGSTGIANAIWKTFTTWTSITSDNNIFFAGNGDTQHLICYDGTNSYQTFDAYQSASGNDSHSYTGDINFVNAVTAPYDLDINPSLSSLADGAGVVITSPVSVTDDYHYQPRATGLAGDLPDIGADEVTLLLLPPSTPGNVSITRATGLGNLTITWDASTGDVKGYHVYSCPTPDFSSERTALVGSTSISTRTLTVPASELPIRMFYRVTAY